MSTLPTLTNLSGELSSLPSLSDVGNVLKNVSNSPLASSNPISAIASNLTSNLFSIGNVVTIVGFVFLIIGLVTLTKLHKPIIEYTKTAAKTASVAAVAA
jgi:beta-lactamase regulating signal transducer with metallopeptidase domain